jgi:formate/nitrite transporter FocA (FNT family)
MADGQTDDNRLSSAAGVSGISDSERKTIARQSRPSAALIHETIRAEGESELERTSWALILSGFAAGLSMGLSLMVEGVLQSRLPDAPWRELVSKSGYTIGFLVVVLGRQQLFTENTVTPILPLLYNRDPATFGRVARLWALVLIANIAATWLIAGVLSQTAVFEPDVKAAFSEISHHALGSSFTTTCLKGVFAGWLIALMVWLLPGAGGMRPIVIMIVTYVVAIASLAHIVAGSVDAAYLVWTSAATATDYLWRFFLPTLLGNTVGGVTLVAVLNYGQVASEIDT